jgi:hypothetical protein
VLINENQDIALLENDITNLYLTNDKRLVNLKLNAHLQPLSDIYLESSHMINDDAISFKFGNKDPLFALSIIAFLILLIAGFNFMTMSTAMSLSRAK